MLGSSSWRFVTVNFQVPTANYQAARIDSNDPLEVGSWKLTTYFV